MSGTGLATEFRAGGLLLTLALLAPGSAASAQTLEARDSVVPADSMTHPAGFQPPIHAVLGLGYGMRRDDCVLCESPHENKSFSGYLGVTRPLWKGLGVGMDVSVWMRGRPGTPGPLDGEGVPEPTKLSNMLGNLSVSVTYDVWHVFARVGAGVSFGSKDLEMENPQGDIIVHTASGFGPGISAGAGVTIPIVSPVSLAVYGNWNMGQYDMVSPQGLIERAARHQYLELGMGMAMR